MDGGRYPEVVDESSSAWVELRLIVRLRKLGRLPLAASLKAGLVWPEGQ